MISLDLLSRPVIHRASLVRFDLPDQTLGLWPGTGMLDLRRAGYGQCYGMGRLSSVDAVEQPVAGTAPQLQLGLHGMAADIVTYVREAETLAMGRRVQIGLMFWTYGDDGQLVFDGYFNQLTGILDRMAISWRRERDNEGVSRELADVTVNVEGLFASRRHAATETVYTGHDQKLRFAGDLGLDQAGTMVNKNYRWPIFIGETP